MFIKTTFALYTPTEPTIVCKEEKEERKGENERQENDSRVMMLTWETPEHK
jgi:hypothetical protein